MELLPGVSAMFVETARYAGKATEAAHLPRLHSPPLSTKMWTSGALFALQEILASWIANDGDRYGSYISNRVPKMAVHGAFISAPLDHLLIGSLYKIFARRTSLKAKILQILANNLIILPIQSMVFIISMAIIAGARTFHQIRATVRAVYPLMTKISWILYPLFLALAQKFLPEQIWVPFFNVTGFIIGTYANASLKKRRIAALRRKFYDIDWDEITEEDEDFITKGVRTAAIRLLSLTLSLLVAMGRITYS